MRKIIKFPTLEDGEVRISIEDARYISLESMTVASILDGKTREEDYADLRYGGEAITLALEYCRKTGVVKYRSTQAQPSESKSDASNNFAPLEVETKCKEVTKEAWVDDFIVKITNYGLGMVHELIAVSQFLSTSGLMDLTCQCLFDYLTFKDYRDFREAFVFQFLFPPYFDGKMRLDIEDMLECIFLLPTLDEIQAEFKDKIPFTPDELSLAELENKSLRVGGNLKYKTDTKSIEELLIKVEYMVRRLSSFPILSFWMNNAFSKCLNETIACIKEYLDDQSNEDIRQLCSTFCGPASTVLLDFMGHSYEGTIERKITNPSRSYEDINVIERDMDKIELEMAAKANQHKRKVEELCEACYTVWQNDHPHRKDKVLPHLTYFLENRYHEIYCALCSLRGWMSAHEVQNHFGKLYDQNGDQDEDVEIEEENEDNNEDEGSEEQSKDGYEEEGNKALRSQESEADGQIRNGIVASMRTLTGLAICTSGDFGDTYMFLRRLQIETRMLIHVNLLLKDEKILAFICNEKFKLYMRASKQGTRSMISFAENKEEFDRIMRVTDQRFGYRGPVIEEAKKKYCQHYRKFHHAMVDETIRLKELNSKCVDGSE